MVKIGLVGYQDDIQGWEGWRVVHRVRVVEGCELGEELGCFLQPNAILPTAPWLHLRAVASLVTEHTLITKDGANYG